MNKYKIVRYYHPDVKIATSAGRVIPKPNEVIRSGLTLWEAQEHCNDPSTAKEGEYFDGYRRETY